MERIDPHVHFRDEQQRHKETIEHGMALAERHGVYYCFDMPNTATPVVREQDVQRRLQLVPKRYSGRYHLYIGATHDPEQLREAARLHKEYPQVIGIKLFAGKSTGDLALLKKEHQRQVYEVLAKECYTGVLAVHCEKEEHMRDAFDPKRPISHAESRPKDAEISSVNDQITFATNAGFAGTLHICHASVPETVQRVMEAREALTMTCGVTPHHLLYDESALEEYHGTLYKMNPPLRSERDMLRLREACLQGQVDWIETDHAPHAVGEKLFEGYPSGHPSLYLYSYLLERLREWGMSEDQLNRMTRYNIQKTFGVPE